MYSRIIFILALLYFQMMLPTSGRDNFREPEGALRLSDALNLAIEKNPELSVSLNDVHIAEAQKQTASQRPNPEISVEVENVFGSGDFSGTRQAETTLQINQPFQMGGKRQIQLREADHVKQIAYLDLEAKRIELSRSVVQKFTNVLRAQQRLEWFDQALQLTEKFVPAAQKRVDAGAASQVELIRFNIQIATARMERDQASRDLEIARKSLAAMWSSTEPAFGRAIGNLENLPSVLPLSHVQKQLLLTPSLKRWNTEYERRKSVYNREKANAKPDITLGAGYRHLSESSDHAAIFSMSLPLPLFNRNEGAIQSAWAETEKATQENQLEQLRLHAALRVAYDNLEAAQLQISMLKETIMPHAKRAFDKVNEGYLAGSFKYLEVVDAQDVLIDSNLRYIEELAAYHQAAGEIIGLAGLPLKNLFSEP